MGAKNRDQSQLDKFKEAARQLETDDSEERLNSLIKKARIEKAVDPDDSKGQQD